MCRCGVASTCLPASIDCHRQQSVAASQQTYSWMDQMRMTELELWRSIREHRPPYCWNVGETCQHQWPPTAELNHDRQCVDGSPELSAVQNDSCFLQIKLCRHGTRRRQRSWRHRMIRMFQLADGASSVNSPGQINQGSVIVDWHITVQAGTSRSRITGDSAS